MRSVLPLIYSLFLLALLVGDIMPAYSQAILETRQWTNLNGKKIQAELLALDNQSNDGTVRLRLKGGNTFKVKPETLIREDQALILKTRFDRYFRSRYSDNMGAHFFYSKQVPKDQRDKTVAYIGNDHKSAWMRIKVSAHSDLVSDGSKLILLGDGASPLRLNYTLDDTDEGRVNSTIDLSLTKHGEALAGLFAKPDRLKVLIETASGSLTEVKLTKPEKQGLKEITSAFKTLSELSSDHVWWTTFQGIDPEVFKKTVEAEAMKEVEAVVEPVNDGPILSLQEWSVNSGQTVFMGELMSFSRHLADFRIDGGSERSFPVEDFDKPTRKILVSSRIDRAVYESWHPYDDEYIWFWPKRWKDSDRRIENQVVLFAVNRETNEPVLFLQHRIETDSAVSVTRGKLKSPKIFLDIDWYGGGSLKLRNQSSSIVWSRLGFEASELLLVAAPGMDSLEYEIVPASGEAVVGKFSDDEYKASIEALEIYRIWNSLHEKEALNPFAEPIPTG